jgi:hypothetical protein
MERKEREPHFVRLDGINDKLADMGIEFGITLMENSDNLRSYRIRAWWRDDEQADYPMDYTDDSNLFDLSEMADAIDWIHTSLSRHLSDRLESIVEKGKKAERFLASINNDESVINGLRL